MQTKKQLRAQLTNDVAHFVAKGGKVVVCDYITPKKQKHKRVENQRKTAYEQYVKELEGA